MDYGQPAACSEWRAVQAVASHFDLEVKRVELGFRLASQSGEFFGRNALLVLTAAGITESRPLIWTLRISSSVSKGIYKSVVQSDGEFLNVGAGGRQ